MQRIKKDIEDFVIRRYGYKIDCNFEYSYKEKLIYSRLAFVLYELTKESAQEIGSEIASNVIGLEAKEGFLNLKIKEDDLLGLLDYEAGKISLEALLEKEVKLIDRKFDNLSYAYIKLRAAFMNLWDKNNVSYDDSYELAMYIFYVYKKEKGMEHLVDLFVSFDKKLVGTKIPYSLYLITFRKLTNYLSNNRSICSSTTDLLKAPR